MEFGTSLAMDWLSDLSTVREVVRSLDGGGVDFVTSGGHVLTARPDRYPDRPAPTYAATYRDAFVLYSHLSAMTERLRFRSSIVILPLLPTVLVAKQAADLSLLSGGRFDLGIGISWQEAEFTALGAIFGNRGRRLEEQISLLRRLWTEPYVTFHGRDHQLDDLGIGQRPDRPIPIWMGTRTDDERVLRRVGRLADGWMPVAPRLTPELIATVRGYAVEAGRAPGDLQVSGRLVLGDDADGWVPEAIRHRDAGVTSLDLVPPPGLSPAESVAAVLDARQILSGVLAQV